MEITILGIEDDCMNEVENTLRSQEKIKTIDFIEDHNLNFFKGNAVLCICSSGSNDPEKAIADLEGAIWYLRREIKRLGGSIQQLGNW